MIEQFSFDSYSFAAFQKPKLAHKACGDSYWLKETEEELIGVIADGLGSGPEAQLASKAAIRTVQQYSTYPVDEIVKKVNEEQMAYRGVVLSIIKLNKKLSKLHFCGVGNIKLKVMTSLSNVDQPRPTRGLLSGRPVDLEVHELTIQPNAWLVMYSDGIDLRNKDLLSLYYLFNNVSEEEIPHKLEATVQPHLNNDDLTILIGKPN